ncbi:MAG TPA: AAA family ATPase [Blastocatellia bacterium]|nr:AAA family ATPase [Blastocatellia bacterium]
MFRLEKLEISGFKSFADRITLVFGEGITAVVGPNGCGKSNLAEAISWVLGEQSAKSLRGGKMEDVIFNGTRDRKPTGMAEVLLTLVAIEDIAARDDETAEKDIEEEYDEAIITAEQAAEAARSLVEEMSPSEAEGDPAEQSAAASPEQSTQATEPDQAQAAAQPEQSTSLESQSASPESVDADAEQIETQPASGDEASASVKHEPPTARLTLPADSTAEANTEQATFASVEQTGGEAIEQQTEAIREVSVEQDKTKDAQKKSKERSRAVHRLRKRRSVAISAGERITVGRRLYRTGDSEYLMNGRPCLLRDIQDLFAGTGLGGAHYAIIEQGRIGQILSSKPLDRRALIEEAAGITKFKSRKRSAELKLESAKQNLTRLNDIISEVERQVNSLKRQAQKARRYRRLREEMRSLLKVVFTADYYRLNEAIDRIARELEEAERNQADFDAQLAERESEHRAVSSEARTAEDRLAVLREQAAAVELEADRARNRRAFEEQQLAELTSRIEEINRDQAQLEERLASLEAQSEQRAADLQALESENDTEQAALVEREAEYQQELARLREAENEIEQLRQRMLTEIGMTERLRNLSASLEEESRKLNLRQSNLRAELERAAARHDEAEAEHARMSAEIETDRTRLADLTARIAERAAELIELRANAATLRTELEATHAERDSSEHRLASLEDLDAHHAYYSDAVQQVLSVEQAARINALGTLADFVEVEAQYEKLIESLFGRELQSVLVPTIDDALAGVEFIKSEELGRGAFLVVGLHGGEGEPADRGQVSEITGHGESDSKPQEKNGIEQWLIATDAEREAALFEEEFIPASIPIERQLPPADFSNADAIVIQLNADAESVISDSHPQTDESAREDNIVARRFDEHEAAHASRFQLDVLRAIDLLGLRPEIKTVVERAFPDKCSALVVPDIEAALQLSIENPSRIYVTYEGEMVVNGRLIVTGAQAGNKGTSLLGLKREIKQLRVQVAMLGEEEQRLAVSLAEVESRRDSLEGEAATLDQELRRHEKESAARNSQLEGLARDLERAAQHVRVVESELEQAEREHAELDERIEQLASELHAAEESREAVQSSLTASQATLVEMRASVEALSEQLSSARARRAAQAERLQAARAELRRIESEAEELRSRINRNRVELYESHNRVEQLTASHAEGANAAAAFEAERVALAERVSAAAEELQTTRARGDELEDILSELRQASSAAHDRRGQIEVERARIESEAEHLARTCFSELAMSLEDVVTSIELGLAAEKQASGIRDQRPGDTDGEAGDEQTIAAGNERNRETVAGDEQALTSDLRPLTTDAEAARARLDELRVKLDEMGPVNMMALEELEEAEERFRFLSEQRRDILDSIKMTEEALSEIKRRSRERFRHAFTHINENFQQMFTELFGGGRGEMVLIDEEDILESGIDLIAQPPGKRLQNVLLLSGGEKAMAAIALVLAIFQYRPSPFCILDEVDAPLDEMNVGRFSNKVIEMSSTTQFLVITHNKRTMEVARALYGVTMEEPGVSKLVSVRFE